MAKAEKQKAKKTSARVAAKPKAAKKVAKPAAKKKVVRIDPLNRKQYTSVTPMLAVRDIHRAVAFYANGLGFTVRAVVEGPQGALHAELRLRESTLMLSPESAEDQNFSANSIGQTPVTLFALVESVDDVFSRAVAAGANVLMPVTDMYWGDRAAMIADPDGNRWMIATHVAEPTEAEIREALERQTTPTAEHSMESAAAAEAGSESEY